MIFSTVYTVNKVTDFVKCKRRRSNKMSTNVIIIRKLFKEKVYKTLFILKFINDYNYYIRNVNLTN